MRRRRPGARGAGLLAAAVVGLVLAAPAPAAHAVAVNAERDTITISVEPTVHLVDGQEVAVRIDAHQDVQLNQITATQCAEHPTNYFELGPPGGKCLKEPLSAQGEVDKPTGKLPAGSASAALTFRVGTGSQELVDLFTDQQRTVRCGPGEPSCVLGLWIQTSTNPELMVSVPLFFGDDAPPPEAVTRIAGTGLSAATATTGADAAPVRPSAAPGQALLILFGVFAVLILLAAGFFAGRRGRPADAPVEVGQR